MSNIKCRFEIIGSGSYLPGTGVSASELQDKMDVDTTWIVKKTGVQNRYYAGDETIASMGAKAVNRALEKTTLRLEDVDLLVAAGGTPDQPIPHNSALIHKELKASKNVTPMDVNATCLSFVQAMKMAASFLETKMYQNIVIVSSEKPSVGLNYKSPESAALMGDGAVAFILTQTNKDKGLIFCDFETYSEGVHLAEISSGGTRRHPRHVKDNNCESFLFSMDGEKIFKLTSQHLEKFVKESMEKNQATLSDFSRVIPHQASLLAMTLMRKKLNIPKNQFYTNIHKYGNLVAASVPMCLHDLLEGEEVKLGEKILMLCTAAGLTIGSMGIQL